MLSQRTAIDLAVGPPSQDFTWVLGSNPELGYSVYNSIFISSQSCNYPLDFLGIPPVELESDSDTDSLSSDFEQVALSRKKTRSWSEVELIHKLLPPPEVPPSTIGTFVLACKSFT